MKNLFIKENCQYAKTSDFRVILSKWIKIQKLYANRINKGLKGKDEDFAWNYGERPCIGFLAAAAWLAGGVALEEWYTRKRKKYGRCDLWIRSKKGKEFFIEAKQFRLTCNTWRDRFEDIGKKLDVAAKCAKQLDCKSSKRVVKMGLLFVRTTFRSNVSYNGLLKERARWLKELERRQHSAIACLFLKPERTGNGVWQSSGILLLARDVQPI